MINSTVQEAGPSSSYEASSYATPNQVTQYQLNWMQRPRIHDPNEIVEID